MRPRCIKSPAPKIFTQSSLGNLYPDEMIWSGFSRLKQKYPHLTDPILNNLQCLCNKRLTRYFILPENLNQLTTSFNFNDKEELLEKHTFLKWQKAVRYNFLYAPYTSIDQDIEPPERYGTTKRSHLTVFSELVLSRNLRTCRQCIKNDLDQFGAMYWHRLHQFNGISMCAIHKESLVSTKVERPNKENFHYTALTNEILEAASKCIYKSDWVSRINGERREFFSNTDDACGRHAFPQSLFPSDICDCDKYQRQPTTIQIFFSQLYC